MATKARVLDRIIDLAYTQALWQFIDTLAVSKVQDTSRQAKENAVMTLVYINTLRITLMLMMAINDGRLFSIEFVSELASIKSDEKMQKFIDEKFRPLLTDKLNVLDRLPKYKEGIQPLVQMIAFLYTNKKDHQVEALRQIHGLLVGKLDDENFQIGTHRLIMSVLAALMTQSDQALLMYPILSALGKNISLKEP